MISFDSSSYGKEVEAILALDGDGERLMPLCGGTPVPAVRKALEGRSAADLFPHSRHPEAALSGLWLYFSFYEESHSLSQNISTVEGSFWHGIMHREEPDADNAAYWFRRVGRHPLFPALREAAAGIVESRGGSFRVAGDWDPFAFIDFCESARRKPGSADERLALEIQRAEWQLLFDWCAKAKS